mgnify:CR=1 FL=1
MKHITCIEDLRQLHKRRVPKAFFDYADRGSYTEDTLRANSEDLQQIKFRQRILVDVSKRSLATTILGEPAAMPLILAPVGLLGMQHGDGEIYACRAAQAAGIPSSRVDEVLALVGLTDTVTSRPGTTMVDLAANLLGHLLRRLLPADAPKICESRGGIRGGPAACRGGQGRGRTADLPLFRRTLVPTELPGRKAPNTEVPRQ